MIFVIKELIIEFLGQKESAKQFGCSEAAVKSWRYGYRNPTVNQAKKIIRATKSYLFIHCYLFSKIKVF